MYLAYGDACWTQALIHDGLAEAKSGRLVPHDPTSEGTRVSRYIEEVERIMNEQVLGDVNDASTWTFPYNQKLKKLGTVLLENTKVRKVVSGFDSLVDISVSDADRKTKWKRSPAKYRVAIKTARQN